MIVSLNWIKEFVDLDGIEVDELVKRFGLSTAEIEKVEYVGRDLENIVVAKILEVLPHPESDHLHILKVDDGSGAPVQVVCGAPNVRVGLKTYFARVGGNVKGMKIKPVRMVGVESNGMCCGGHELGIEADTSGIVELDDSAPVGKNIKEMLPVEDVLIEIDNKSLTNRPDLWGHYGIAREFSAIFKRKLKPLKLDDLSTYKNLKPLSIKVETKNCFRYTGIAVENILKHISSPIMKLRLNYCGMRDINLLADLTNYIMLELGQPMHAYDNRKVSCVEVKTLKEDSEFTTLDAQSDVKNYAIDIAEYFQKNHKEIDDIIQKYAKNWDLGRLVKMDKDILRIAIVELLYMKDAPMKVVVDEALELAKKYSTDDSASFINGILAKVIVDYGIN